MMQVTDCELKEKEKLDKQVIEANGKNETDADG
jgi:hypothetical protein